MTKIAVSTVPPSVVTVLRCAIAAVLIGLYAAAVSSWRERLQRPPPDVVRGSARQSSIAWAGASGIATGLAFVMVAIGMQHASSGVAAISMATVPAWTMVMSGLAGVDRFGPRQLAAVAVGTTALGVLALASDGRWALHGIIALSVAAFAHGCANVASQMSLRNRAPVTVAAISLAVATLVTAPAAITKLPIAVPSSGVMIAIIVLGALPSAAAYILYFHAVAVLGIARSAISNYLIPPIGILAGMLALGERPDGPVTLALVLAVGALTIGLSDRVRPRHGAKAHAVSTGKRLACLRVRAGRAPRHEPVAPVSVTAVISAPRSHPAPPASSATATPAALPS